MTKRKTTTYKFLRKVNYAPLGDKEYPEGTADALTDWKREHIASAVRTGLIEESEESVVEQNELSSADDEEEDDDANNR